MSKNSFQTTASKVALFTKFGSGHGHEKSVFETDV
jgi:hypothetical protein